MLFGPTARGGLSNDGVPNLHVSAMFEPFVKARVPQDENVEVLAVGSQHSEPAAGMIECRIFSNSLSWYPKDCLELAWSTLTPDYQRVKVEPKILRQRKSEIQVERLSSQVAVLENMPSKSVEKCVV